MVHAGIVPQGSFDFLACLSESLHCESLAKTKRLAGHLPISKHGIIMSCNGWSLWNLTCLGDAAV